MNPFKDWSKRSKIQLVTSMALIIILLISCVSALSPQTKVTGLNLVTIGGTGKLQNYDGSTAITINHLSDVQFVGLQNGQVLGYNSSTSLWQNMNVTATGGGNVYAFSNLTDVNFVGLADGNIPIYDVASGKWVNQAPFSAGWNNTVNQLIGLASITTAQITGFSTAVNSLISSASILWSQITNANTTVAQLISVASVSFTQLTNVPNIGAYSFIIQANDPVPGNYSARYPNGTIGWTSIVANDTFNSAISTLSTNGGGRISVSIGTYNFSAPLTPKSNVWLDGSGRSTVFCQPTSSSFRLIYASQSLTNFKISNLAVINTQSGGPDGYDGIAFYGGVYSNIEFDHVYQSGSTQYGLDMRNCTNFKIVNSEFLTNSNDGITLMFCHNGNIERNTANDSVTYNGISICYCTGVTISSNICINNRNAGIALENDGCNNNTIVSNIIQANTGTRMSYIGIKVYAANISYFVIDSNSIYLGTPSGNYEALDIETTGVGGIVSNNNFYGGNHGCYCASSYVKFYGNNFFNIDTDYMYFASGAIGNTIQGCTFVDYTNTHNTGINIQSGASGNIFKDNYVYNCTNAYADGGTYNGFINCPDMNPISLGNYSYMGQVLTATVSSAMNAGQLVYLSTTQTYLNASATSISTMLPIGLTTQSAALNAKCVILQQGYLNMPSWNWTTLGSGTPLYCSTTGVLTTTYPAATGNIDYPCAYPIAATIIHFSGYPYSNSWVTHA
jgi:parallel beta-helix repeat protein